MRRVLWLLALCACHSTAMAKENLCMVIRGDTLTVSGEPNAVQDFGLTYLSRINPKIMDTAEGRKSVGMLTESAKTGTVLLYFKRGVWRDAALSLISEQ